MAEEEKPALVAPSQDELPETNGVVPRTVVVNLGGKSQRIHRAFTQGEKVILLVEAEISSIGTQKGTGGPALAQKATALDIFHFAPEAGERILRAMKKARNADEGERLGRAPELDPGVEVTTDANGVLLTEDEVAAARGNEAAVLDELGVPLPGEEDEEEEEDGDDEEDLDEDVDDEEDEDEDDE